MNSRRFIIKKFLILFLILSVAICFFAGAVSCKVVEKTLEESLDKAKQLSEQTTAENAEGCISLLDSLDVGDIPSYPNSEYDEEIYRDSAYIVKELWALPAGFEGAFFSASVTEDSPSEVANYYLAEMKSLEWEKIMDEVGEDGGFSTWKKLANTGKYVSCIIFSGEYKRNNEMITLIAIGTVIPESDDSVSTETETVETTAEEKFLPGTISFEHILPPAGAGLLATKPISMGIDEWELWLQEGSSNKGINKVTLKDDSTFFKIVEFYRYSDPDDGGAAGIYQKINLDVQKYYTLNIWLVVKVITENGGNIANVSPGWFTEGAVQVRIKYIIEDGSEKEWYQGFYYSNLKKADKAHFTQIKKGKWFWYISPNLMDFDEKPAKITEIWVYGFGWDFKGIIAEIDIMGL